MPDLFVSHATKDDVHVNHVAEILTACGLSVWVDHDNGIVPGNPNWDRAIRSAIQDCAAGVLIMSPRSLASDMCTSECLLVRELGKPLYVALLESCKPEEIWLTIKMIQYADLSTDLAAGLDKLISAIRGAPGADLPTALRGKLTGSDVMRANLPYLNTVPLIGRDDDLAVIRARLGPHVTQIVAVGGTGKSRMAAEIALSYASGAIWHRCGELSAAYQLVEGIRTHYGLDDKLKEETVLAALDSGTPPLIVVDNGESVAPGTPARSAYDMLLARLMAHGAPVLLTTRVFWDELKPHREIDLRPVPTDTAAAIARAFAGADEVTLNLPDAAALADACHQHPRLIEFAVGQLRRRDVTKVIRQLHELKHHDVQKALDEMIVQSVRQMTEQADCGEEAAALLPCLTVFRGAFDGAAVYAVKPSDMDEDTADDALAVLQDWRFVRREAARYIIDGVVIDAIPPVEGAAARHFAHYFDLHGDFDTNNDEDRHPQLQADWLNIRAALDWGFVQQAEQAVDFAWALHYFMNLRLPRAEWRAVLAEAQTAAARIGYPRGQAHTLRALGDVARMQNEYGAAREVYGRAMPLYEAVGERLGQANTLKALGDVARMQNEYGAAREVYGRAMPLYEAVGERLGQANTLKALGDVALYQNEYGAAREAYGRAMPLYEAVGDRLGQANTLQALGDVARLQNEYAAAREAYGRAMPLYEAVGERVGQANTLRALGDVARMQNEYGAAREAYGRAMPLYEAVGDRLGQAHTLRALGDVARMQNEYAAAREVYLKALALAEQIGEFSSRLNCLAGLARLERVEGNREAACAYYRQRMALAATHPYYSNSPTTQSLRREFADLDCEGSDA